MKATPQNVAGALVQLAALALLYDTRVELAGRPPALTDRDGLAADAIRRELLETAGDTGPRLDAAERMLAELLGIRADTERRLAVLELHARDETQTSATAANAHTSTFTPRRRLQRTGEDVQARDVHIYTADLTAGSDASAESPGRGRRRTQARACGAAELEPRTAEITAACCNEPEEDCSSGPPAVCNAECASMVLGFWEDCQSELGKSLRTTFHEVVRQCQDADVGRADFSDAQQLQLTCTDGSASAQCIPECVPELHGDLLLANIDGEDSRYSCELHHSLYSWMGSGADGGFLGRDAIAFLSSLLSGAAGAYRLIVTEDAEIHTDVRIEPGMDVHIAGAIALEDDPPYWGTGSFSVGERARLSLSRLVLDLAATVAVVPGGDLILTELTLGAGQLDWSETIGSTLSLSGVKFGGTSVVRGDPCDGGATISPVTVAGGSGVIDFRPQGGYTPNDPDCMWSNAHHCQPLCTWTVDCPGASVEFLEFATEGGWDFVRVGDSPWISGDLTAEGIGADHSPVSYTANALAANTTIRFFADQNSGGTGFLAAYTTVQLPRRRSHYPELHCRRRWTCTDRSYRWSGGMAVLRAIRRGQDRELARRAAASAA